MLLHKNYSQEGIAGVHRLIHQHGPEKPDAGNKIETADANRDRPKGKEGGREASEKKTAEVEMAELKIMLKDLLSNKRWRQLQNQKESLAKEGESLSRDEQRELDKIESAYNVNAIQKYWELHYQLSGERRSEVSDDAGPERENALKVQADKLLKSGYKEIDIKSSEAKQIVMALKEAIPITSKVAYAIAEAERGNVYILIRDDLGKLGLYLGREK